MNNDNDKNLYDPENGADNDLTNAGESPNLTNDFDSSNQNENNLDINDIEIIQVDDNEYFQSQQQNPAPPVSDYSDYSDDDDRVFSDGDDEYYVDERPRNSDRRNDDRYQDNRKPQRRQSDRRAPRDDYRDDRNDRRDRRKSDRYRDDYDDDYDNYDDDDGYDKPKKKANFIVFYIAIIVTLLIVFIISIVVVLKIMSDAPKNPPDNLGTHTDASETANPTGNVKKEILAIIKDTGANNRIEVYDFSGGQSYSVYFDSNSQIKDRFNKDLDFSDLQVGDIANLEFYSKTNNIVKFALDDGYWERAEATHVEVKNSNNTITIGDEEYSFDNQLMFFHKGERSSLNTLAPTDIIYVKGYNRQILTMNVLRSHGLITVTGGEKIKEGVLEFGSAYMSAIEEIPAEGFEVAEGNYIITVRGANIEKYTKEIKVEERDSLSVNLDDVVMKKGSLTVKMTPVDAKFYVDGKIYDTSEPIELEYGKYEVKVERENFATQTQEIEVDKDVLTLEVRLEESAKLGKVYINTNPSGAEIYIDNIFLGNSPIEYEMELGNHTVTARKEGYHEVTSPFVLTENGFSATIELPAIEEEPIMPDYTEPPIENTEPPTESEEPTTDITVFYNTEEPIRP